MVHKLIRAQLQWIHGVEVETGDGIGRQLGLAEQAVSNLIKVIQ